MADAVLVRRLAHRLPVRDTDRRSRTAQRGSQPLRATPRRTGDRAREDEVREATWYDEEQATKLVADAGYRDIRCEPLPAFPGRTVRLRGASR